MNKGVEKMILYLKGKAERKEPQPQIAVVIEKGVLVGIATAGQGMMVRLIDLDVREIKDYMPDIENKDLELYTKEMMEDDIDRQRREQYRDGGKL